jgi:hypothetical protein
MVLEAGLSNLKSILKYCSDNDKGENSDEIARVSSSEVEE